MSGRGRVRRGERARGLGELYSTECGTRTERTPHHHRQARSALRIGTLDERPHTLVAWRFGYWRRSRQCCGSFIKEKDRGTEESRRRLGETGNARYVPG